MVLCELRVINQSSQPSLYFKSNISIRNYMSLITDYVREIFAAQDVISGVVDTFLFVTWEQFRNTNCLIMENLMIIFFFVLTVVFEETLSSRPRKSAHVNFCCGCIRHHGPIIYFLQGKLNVALCLNFKPRHW